MSAGQRQRGRDVVAVAQITEPQAVRPAEVLADGQHVGQGLAGVTVVAQTIDDRHRRPLRQLLDFLVRIHARHDALHHAGEHARNIGDAFAFAQADFLRSHHDGVPAQMVHANLERDARAQRGLLKEHAQGLARQQGTVAASAPFAL